MAVSNVEARKLWYLRQSRPLCAHRRSLDRRRITIEDLLVSLCNKIWKGARQDDLENLLVQRISNATGKPAWEVYDKLDSWLTDLASGGDERLEALRRT